MANKSDDPPTQFLGEGAAGAIAPVTRSLTDSQMSNRREGSIIDWRTIDPSTIQGQGIPVEELRFYCEKIDEILRDGIGQYVLIVGCTIVSYFKDLDEAVRHAERIFPSQTILIKKVAAIEPVQAIERVFG